MAHSRYKHIAIVLTEEAVVNYICCNKENAKRIINRAIQKGWWFVSFQYEGEHHIAFANGVDFDKDIRDKLKGIEFRVDM